MVARSIANTIQAKSHFQNGFMGHRLMLFFRLLGLLGRFWVHFGLLPMSCPWSDPPAFPCSPFTAALYPSTNTLWTFWKAICLESIFQFATFSQQLRFWGGASVRLRQSAFLWARAGGADGGLQLAAAGAEDCCWLPLAPDDEGPAGSYSSSSKASSVAACPG